MINKLVIPGVVTTLLTAAPVIATSFLLTSEYPYLKIIEFHFYDKSNTSKKVRLSVEDVSDIRSISVFEEDNQVVAVSSKPAASQEHKGKWKQIEKLENTQNTVMWNTLTDIAKNFIQVQHNLNIVKSSLTSEKTETLSKLCGDPKKCCCKKASGAAQCDCTKGQCCSSCICCYAKKTNGKDCCCKKGSECKFDELDKEQKLFNFLLSNLLSWNDVYFGPVQAHIKLPTVDFSNLNESATEGTTTTWAPLIGSLVYGFMNYSYESIKTSENIIPENIEKKLEKDKYSFFTNVPQRFQFPYKKKNGNGTETEPQDSLNKILTATNSPTLVKSVANSYTKPTEIKQCCTEEADKLNCLITKNYVFLKEQEKNDLKEISEKIKNAKDCCSS